MQICYIDIIDKCNLRCPTCVRGTQLLKNSATSMSLDLFSKIVEKAKIEEYDTIGIYNWIEPFLCKDLKDFVSVVKDQGLFCELSSNLSLKPASYFDNIQQALVAGVDRLTISVSGYNQGIYQINHVGGNINWVKENLDKIALLRRENVINTKIFLRHIKFDYNIDEELVLRNYAKSLDIEFEVIDGVGHPKHPVNGYESENFYIDRLKNYNTSMSYEKNGEICPLIMDTIAINSEGDIYLCCAYPYYSSLRIGRYLNISKDDILLQRYSHPICPSCALPRRKATANDCDRLIHAIKFRLGYCDDDANDRIKEPAKELAIVKLINSALRKFKRDARV